MGRAAPWLLVPLFACLVNSQHAEVKLANNPVGADCFARCVQAEKDPPEAVDCVASCPGADRDSGGCEGGTGCVEDRRVSGWKTTLYIIAAVLVMGATTQ